jgi:hypothetical protein
VDRGFHMFPQQTSQPFRVGYQKLSDFVQHQKRPLPETQEIRIIPRMNLPTRDMATNEFGVPWVTAWSSKTETQFIATSKAIEQTPICTPSREMLSEIETQHLSTPKSSKATPQANEHISTCVSTEQEIFSHPSRRLRRHAFLGWLCAFSLHKKKRIATPKRHAKHRRC